MVDLNKIVDIEVGGIDNKDYPDFCDAYIREAYLDLGNKKFRKLTEIELDWINTSCREFVYNQVINYIY